MVLSRAARRAPDPAQLVLFGDWDVVPPRAMATTPPQDAHLGPDWVLDVVGDEEEEDGPSSQGVIDTVAEELAADEPTQLASDEPRTRRLERLVANSAGAGVRVVITDNRHSLLSWRRAQDDERHPYVLRAHHMFLDAPEHVAHAVGRWMVSPRRGTQDSVVDAYMADHRHLVTRDRRPLAPPAGTTHDLQAIFDELNAQEFRGAVAARIGWGFPGTPRRRARRSIQLGCFDPEARTIAIHPALDQDFVPRFFVATVVFHEMLHEQVPAQESDQRRCVHTPEFKAREASFVLYPHAVAWQRENLGKLLRYSADNRGPRRNGRSRA